MALDIVAPTKAACIGIGYFSIVQVSGKRMTATITMWDWTFLLKGFKGLLGGLNNITGSSSGCLGYR